MNKLQFFCTFFACMQLCASEINVHRIANAIYIIEGGKNTRHPYGVKSINTGGNSNRARIICINTIRNTHRRWIAANKPIPFLDYLANRYCPPSADKLGNARWRRNIRKYLQKIN